MVLAAGGSARWGDRHLARLASDCSDLRRLNHFAAQAFRMLDEMQCRPSGFGRAVFNL
ncbi:hypothetical protein MHPYR_890003 [uncultured Mycobacterium sp.]|uniref:Uncharacterized protein n=1 Tax=uncultured Mycobacterium sp. TaxID=171292 RepID=A0A1Y5PQG3_9MYCO|nr:hypothetical protein MHPYR_890003 [uncultured Mycobacterium sp.]